MKKVFILTALLFACGKKKEEPPAPPSSPSAPAAKQVSVKINGQLFTCDMCANTYFSGGLHGVNVSQTGTPNRFVFNFDTMPAPGTHLLEKYGRYSLTYEKDGFYYRGRGELTVTTSEAAENGSLRKFKANFACRTDTASDGTHYTFTEGSINID